VFPRRRPLRTDEVSVPDARRLLQPTNQQRSASHKRESTASRACFRGARIARAERKVPRPLVPDCCLIVVSLFSAARSLFFAAPHPHGFSPMITTDSASVPRPYHRRPLLYFHLYFHCSLQWRSRSLLQCGAQPLPARQDTHISTMARIPT